VKEFVFVLVRISRSRLMDMITMTAPRIWDLFDRPQTSMLHEPDN
jgi:hypothetical protein